MAKPSLEEIEQFVQELILPFYAIERDMALPLEKRRMENDAEHSWSLALLGSALAPLVDEALDIGKVCQFAIIHDLIEVYAGDTSVWDDDRLLATKEDREKQAVQTMAERFPHFPWLYETIETYESKKSKEAKFVWALDKLLALLIRFIDKGEFYVVEKKIDFEQFQKGIALPTKKAHADPVIGLYYDELLQIFREHPEFFYQKSKSD